jgi:hypothetical protein
VGDAFRRADDERRRMAGCERWPAGFLLPSLAVPKSSDVIDTVASGLESSVGRSSFSARTLNDVSRFKSDRRFSFIVLIRPFLQDMLLPCSQVYLLPLPPGDSCYHVG